MSSKKSNKSSKACQPTPGGRVSCFLSPSARRGCARWPGWLQSPAGPLDDQSLQAGFSFPPGFRPPGLRYIAQPFPLRGRHGRWFLMRCRFRLRVLALRCGHALLYPRSDVCDALSTEPPLGCGWCRRLYYPGLCPKQSIQFPLQR